MPVVDIFSKREGHRRDEVPDVYQYEMIPETLRVQIINIMNDAIEILEDENNPDKLYEYIHKTLSHEYGVCRLTDGNQHSNEESIRKFLHETPDAGKVMDVIELFLQHIERFLKNIERINECLPDNIPIFGNTSTIGMMRQSNALAAFTPSYSSIDDLNYTQFLLYRTKKRNLYKKSIDELNYRFHEHKVGYQYESSKMIRVDSRFTHSEVVQPALNMLSGSMYAGVNAEFLSAHNHYREKRYKECLNDCLKAIESCLKAICSKREWSYSETDTANNLISIVFKNRLIPDFMQSHFTGLRSTLESGVPPIRNRQSGHGQGSKETSVLEYIAAYALHLTASNLLLLAKADENMKESRTGKKSSAKN